MAGDIEKTLKPETVLALRAAKEAGEVILGVYKSKIRAEFKNDFEPVTKADIESNKVIEKILSHTKFPILSEEGDEDLKRLKHRTLWIVDPLDGTVDFIRRTGEFSVMLALVDNHKPVMGIIYQPTENIIYLAEKGRGAHKFNGETWERVAVRPESSKSQIRLRVITSRSHLSEEEQRFLGTLSLGRVTQKGSCGLKVGEVASGNADLYFTTTGKIKQWDTAAAYCLIHEAGGKMTDMLGGALVYNTEHVNHASGILATRGDIHEQIVGRYKQFVKSKT
jgi:3'(2'), 5'-bisphosphate nucleotidase